MTGSNTDGPVGRPIAVRFSDVLRLSTVARRTVAITPFATTTQEVRDRRTL
jgi:hypothetical protein